MYQSKGGGGGRKYMWDSASMKPECVGGSGGMLPQESFAFQAL